jgi:hypothetical protein
MSIRVKYSGSFEADLAKKCPAYGCSRADGRSLAPLLSGQGAPWRDAALTEHPGWPGVPSHSAVVTKGASYVEWGTGERELYDLQADPYELTNLLHEPTAESETKAAELSARLDALKDCAGDSCKAAEGP